MTYKELQAILAQLNDDQLNCNVTVYDRKIDEFLPTRLSLQFASRDTQVLDPEHPFFVLRPVRSH
jgi:hypothetical protein